MGTFAILFFFAVTGLTLNHTEWFAKHQKTTQTKGKVDRQWTRGADAKQVAKLEIVEHLRKTHRIAGALTDFRVDDNQCSISFKGPGYTADIFLDRDSAAYDATITYNGFWAVLNDLHKGRDSGRVWAAVIDASAVLMTLVSLTGLILIFFLQKKRVSGLLLALAGAVLSYLLYAVWVP